MKSKYLGIWSLLAIALVIVCAISFADDIYIFGFKLKKAPIASALTSEYLTQEEKQKEQQEAKILLEEQAKPQENPVDSTPQSILIFGDSMTQNLALRLSAYAKQNGHQVHSINWDSSGTRIWAQTDTLYRYIREFKPSFIFVALGSNELYIRNLDKYKEYVETILKKIGDIPYVWIGPPNWKPDEGINDMLQATTAPGTYFRSEGIKLDRKKDQIHPTRDAAAIWFDSIARWMPHSAHPIKLDFPADSIHAKLSDTNIIYLKAKH